MLNHCTTSASISSQDDAYNVLCTRYLHAPPAVVRTLQALSGLLEGRTNARFYHYELSQRLFPWSGDDKRTQENNVQTAGRWLDKTIEWLDAHNIPHTYTAGGRTKDGAAIRSSLDTSFFALLADLVNRVANDETRGDQFTTYLYHSKAIIEDYNNDKLESDQIWIQARTRSKPANNAQIRLERNEKQAMRRAIKCSEQRAKRDDIPALQALAALLDETAQKFIYEHPEECEGARVVVSIAYDGVEGVNFEYHPAVEGVNFEDISDYRATFFEDEDGAAGRDALEQSIEDDEITEWLEIEPEREPIRDGSDDDDAPRCSISPEPLFSDPARDALRIFQSVGVGCFDESTTVDNRRDYVRALPVDTLLEQIDERMTIQTTGSPYILRPIPPGGVALIQLDDIDVGRVAELERIAFIIYQTSEAKWQAWLAVTCDDGTRDALRRSLIDHFGADRSASGATRWPGSLNQKYSPPYRVTIRHAAPGRVLRVADLPVTPAPPRVATGRELRGSGTLPDYQTELARAANANAADWSFSIKALSPSRGCSEQEVIDALMAHSPTAKTRPKMISYTVRRAARAVTL